MKQFWFILTLFFIGSITFAVLTHAAGFATSAGTLLTGVNTMGKILEGR